MAEEETTTLARKLRDWTDALREKGHIPRRDRYGDVDFFVVDVAHHNGPGCSRCGEAWCWHCKDIEQIKECPGPFEKSRKGKTPPE